MGWPGLDARDRRRSEQDSHYLSGVLLTIRVHLCLLALAVSILPPRNGRAQTPSRPTSAAVPGAGEIRGRIVNAASKAPIDVGTVDVLKRASDVVLARSSVGVDGRFRLEDVRDRKSVV